MQDANKSAAGQCSHASAQFPQLSSNPGVSAWKHGAPTEGIPEKKTWQKERVFRDILEHRMLPFSADQQQQWHALHQFHNLYPTADSVPALPIHLQPPSGSTYTMERGSPIDWNAMWGRLAWRFSRPHQPAATAGPAAGAAAAAGTEAAVEGDKEPPLPPNPALVNGATGGNNRKLSKKHAKADSAVISQANALKAKGIPADELKVNSLHFAVTPTFEGEFAVGLVRIESPESNGKVGIAWWKRKGVDLPAKWSETPTFEPFMPSGKVEKHQVEADTLLSPPIILTPTSSAAYKPAAKSIAGQTVRLKKDCITLLRTFLTIHRPELIDEDESTGEDESSSED